MRRGSKLKEIALGELKRRKSKCSRGAWRGTLEPKMAHEGTNRAPPTRAPRAKAQWARGGRCGLHVLTALILRAFKTCRPSAHPHVVAQGADAPKTGMRPTDRPVQRAQKTQSPKGPNSQGAPRTLCKSFYRDWTNADSNSRTSLNPLFFPT